MITLKVLFILLLFNMIWIEQHVYWFPINFYSKPSCIVAYNYIKLIKFFLNLIFFFLPFFQLKNIYLIPLTYRHMTLTNLSCESVTNSCRPSFRNFFCWKNNQKKFAVGKNACKSFFVNFFVRKHNFPLDVCY